MKALTREEAIKALDEGERLRHRHFSDHEWIEKGGRGIICEDGCSIDQFTFWMDRSHVAFDTDWFIVQKSNLTENKSRNGNKQVK